MKLTFSVLLVLALATVAHGISQTWGRRNSTDLLLFSTKVQRPWQRSATWSVDVNFPESGKTNNRIITFMNVTDTFRNQTGARPTCLSGGPNYRFANINLRSAFQSGIASTVEIWGKK